MKYAVALLGVAAVATLFASFVVPALLRLVAAVNGKLISGG